MGIKSIVFIFISIVLFSCCNKNNANKSGSNGFSEQMPHIKKLTNGKSQLIVDGKPYIILGGELGNSSASSLEFLEKQWANLKQMNINTILAPVYWELIEKEEGRFDFSLVDGLIKQARLNDIKLVLLWFGSWKNSMACYVPGWVKSDYKRFPRARDLNGKAVEILSPFYRSNLEADKKAFIALMKHLKDFDSKENTVIMIQVENEIGMLPVARDYSDSANINFKNNMPVGLIDYLNKNVDNLQSDLKEKWQKIDVTNQNDNWEDVFGASLATDEFFMAWYYAVYTNEITKAGKDVYNLPMFLNVALNRPGWEPGEYPSAGPLPHLMDIWKAGAPDVDFISPDVYFGEFTGWCKKYDRADNPLFVPEIDNSRSNHINILYALGRHNTFGLSPFSIESLDANKGNGVLLSKSYEMINNVWLEISKYQAENKVSAFFFSNEQRKDTAVLGNFKFCFAHDFTLGWSSEIKDYEIWPETAVLIVQISDNEFIVCGMGVVIKFESDTSDSDFVVGIKNIERGCFNNEGKWQCQMVLNGDQSHQGRHLRIPFNSFEIQKVSLYTYK